MPTARAQSADPDHPPKGWHPDVWRFRCALVMATARRPYATAEARALDGAARWVGLSGRYRAPTGDWWRKSLALAKAAADCAGDLETQALLAPWTARLQANGAAGPAASTFRPFGVDTPDGEP